MPRGKFIQNMIVNILAINLAAAVNLLALFCVVQARAYTTPLGSPTTSVSYNASASAVCGVWLFLQIYIVNCGRAARPQYQFAAILYSIFVSLSMTNGVFFRTMPQAAAFMKQLLEAFLTGFGLATAVSILIFPTSSRKMVWQGMAAYLLLMKSSLQEVPAYMESLHPEVSRQSVSAPVAKRTSEQSTGALEAPTLPNPKDTQTRLINLHSKLGQRVALAKHEIAIGKLEPQHIDELWKLFQQIFIPILGLMSMLDILECQPRELAPEKPDRERAQSQQTQFLIEQLEQSIRSRIALLEDALQHILITLQLISPERTKKADEESIEKTYVHSGECGFVESFKKKLGNDYVLPKQSEVPDLDGQHGMDMPSQLLASCFHGPEAIESEHGQLNSRHELRIFLILYVQYLLWRAAISVLDLLVYIDNRKQDGTLEKSRMVFPQSKVSPVFTDPSSRMEQRNP